MTKGISLHIGLNSVDPQHYEGWSGPLNACEADANDMADLAQTQGFETAKLLTKKATRSAVVDGIADAAKTLKSGDFFLLTYSGHGGQVPDLNSDESDRQDETWCLYDAQLIDDELYSSWGAFAAGVRIFVLSDSCHSGTVTKAVHYAGKSRSGPSPIYRAMPNEVALRVYQSHKTFYDPILENRDLEEAQAAVKASVLLISGCQDNQLSLDGTFNGLFTGTLKIVWNGGTFTGSYRSFRTAIGSKMPPDQTPNMSRVGASNGAFIAQRPFTIDTATKGSGAAKKMKRASKRKRKQS